MDDALIEGDPDSPISTAAAIRTGHAFLNDIAHSAVPTGKVADGDTEVSLANLDGSDTSGNYDNELLDSHYITGDGRGNENIGLTAVHHVFHAEHNRLVGHLKDVILAELGSDPAFVSQWLVPGANLADGVQRERMERRALFQAARFGDRDAVPAPRLRRIRTPHSAEHRRIRGASTSRSIQPSWPSSRMRSIVSATRCCARPLIGSTPTATSSTRIRGRRAISS